MLYFIYRSGSSSRGNSIRVRVSHFYYIVRRPPVVTSSANDYLRQLYDDREDAMLLERISAQEQKLEEELCWNGEEYSETC